MATRLPVFWHLACPLVSQGAQPVFCAWISWLEEEEWFWAGNEEMLEMCRRGLLWEFKAFAGVLDYDIVTRRGSTWVEAGQAMRECWWTVGRGLTWVGIWDVVNAKAILLFLTVFLVWVSIPCVAPIVQRWYFSLFIWSIVIYKALFFLFNFTSCHLTPGLDLKAHRSLNLINCCNLGQICAKTSSL